MRPGGENIPVDLAPPTLPASATGHEIRIVAANRRFVVTWFWRASDRFAPAVFYVHDRQLGKWRDLKFQWNLPQSRIFGSWLATIAMSYVGIGPGGWHDTNPGRMDESHPWVKYEHPDVRFEFGALRMGDRIPGTLILDNLADGRRITLKTNEEDSEILDVRKNGLVLYRVNNEVFSTKIEGDKLSAPKLVVKGEDVPEVHWAFWSKAGTEPRALAEGAPRQKKPFTLTLAAPKQPHRAGQPLLLHLTVRSTSDRALRVPVTRGVFWVRLAYQVHVLDQRGQPPPPAPELVPKRKDQVVLGGGSMPSRRLEPGKSLSDLVNVTSLYDLGRPGKYKIWVAELGYRGPHGLVRSNTVTVTVVK